VHLAAFHSQKSPRRLGRLIASAAGLLIFNLFMVVPALVFASVLAAVYASAFAFYLCGIVIACSGLAGVNEIVLTAPLKHASVDGEAGPTVIRIGATGVRVHAAPASDAASEGDVDDDRQARSARGALREVREVASDGVRLYNDMDGGARTTQALVGLAMVIGGIGLFLVSLVVTALTGRGLRRYVDMNIALLKNS
jgi:hypothetical protein